MDAWTTFPPPLPDRPILCRSMGGTRVLFRPSVKLQHIEVVILDDSNNELMTVDLHLRMGAGYLLWGDEDRSAIILFFRDGLRHPANDQSGISWFNAEGKGFLRIIDLKKKRFLALPLLGLAVSPDAPFEPRSGQRGPSRSTDLWIMATALCLPRGFAVQRMVEITRLSEMLVRNRLNELVNLGLIAGSRGGINNRTHRYMVPFRDTERITTFMQDRWQGWKKGTGTTNLRPTYHHFTATAEWPILRAKIREIGIHCFASGVTALEDDSEQNPKTNEKDRRWIQPQGLIPELNLMVSESDLNRLITVIGVTLYQTPKRQSSTVCVLADDHPAMLLHAYRKKNDYFPEWPKGLSALDAMQHEDPRVVEAASVAWKWWIENQAIEQDKDYGNGAP